LTLDSRKAADLAQETWCRLLRARCSLKPEGNFSGYLMTIAANLWRDSHRLARRAGAMADDQLLSLDQTISNVGGEPDVLGDMVHDSKASDETERSAMDIDLDNALGRLTPLLRDVLESRFINGESSAEIGDRYNRTEQCVTGWIRQAIREVKTYLSDSEFSE
jgi:RNA polymerase sigma factor (sigma-70 family)